jgi:prophage regulatory protein
MTHTILRLPAVKTQTGYSRSTIYLRIAQGLWPKQVSLGPRCIGWPAHEVAALNAMRIAGKSDEEIRNCVLELETTRKTILGAKS